MKAISRFATPALIGLAAHAVTALGGASAQAQPAGHDPSDPGYAQQQQDYQRQQQHYQDAQSAYTAQKDAYHAARDDYDELHARFLHDQAKYDAHHGQGAYVRYWSDRHGAYDDRFGEGAWDRDFGDHHDHDRDRRDSDDPRR